MESYLRWALATAAVVAWECDLQSGGRFPRSADDAFSVIQKKGRAECGIHIAAYMLDKDPVYKVGLFMGLVMQRKRGREAKILINPYLDRSALRLALVQESFQALMGVALDRRKSVAKKIRAELDGWPHLSLNPEISIGEILAEVAAMELLFPFSARQKLLRKKGSAERLKDRIAKQASADFGVPLRWVRFYLRQDIMHALAPYADGRQPRRSRQQ